MNETLEKVIWIISEFVQMDDAALDEDTHLVNDLGLDSMDLSEIALMVEEEFDVVVDDETIEGFKAISDICEFLEQNKGPYDE